MSQCPERRSGAPGTSALSSATSTSELPLLSTRRQSMPSRSKCSFRKCMMRFTRSTSFEPACRFTSCSQKRSISSLFRSTNALISSIGAFISVLPFYFENTDAVIFRMYQHVFFTLKDKQIYTTKRKYPRQEESKYILFLGKH